VVVAGKKLVILDFDGVVADSFDRQYRWLSFIHEKLGVEKNFSDKEGLREIYCEPFWPNLYDSLGFDTTDAGPHTKTIYSEYKEFLPKNPVSIVPGFPEAMRELHSTGKYDFAVASMSGNQMIAEFFAEHGIYDCLLTLPDGSRAISGKDDVGRDGNAPERLKPSPFIIDNVLGKIGDLSQYSEIEYLGDAPSDVKAARAAGISLGVKVIPVSLVTDAAFYTKEKILSEKPDKVAYSTAELLSVL